MSLKIVSNPTHLTSPLSSVELLSQATAPGSFIASSATTGPKRTPYSIARDEAASALDHLIHTAVTPAPGSKTVREFLSVGAGQIGSFTTVLSAPLAKNPQRPLALPSARYLFELSDGVFNPAASVTPAPNRHIAVDLKWRSTRTGDVFDYVISPVKNWPIDGTGVDLFAFEELRAPDLRAFNAYADLARLFIAVQTSGSEPYTNALRRFSEFARAKGRITGVSEDPATGKIEFVKTVLEGMGTPDIVWSLMVIRCPDTDDGKPQFAVTLRKNPIT